jgi:hypothetical protein
MKLFKRKNRIAKGIDAINSHHGKKRVYENYKRSNPQLAEKYLEFVSKNVSAVYIWWDKERQCFAG